MATFNGHLSSHDTNTSTSYVVFVYKLKICYWEQYTFSQEAEMNVHENGKRL